MGLGKIGIDLDGPANVAFRRAILAANALKKPQIVVGQGVSVIDRERSPVMVDRLVELAELRVHGAQIVLGVDCLRFQPGCQFKLFDRLPRLPLLRESAAELISDKPVVVCRGDRVGQERHVVMPAGDLPASLRGQGSQNDQRGGPQHVRGTSQPEQARR